MKKLAVLLCACFLFSQVGYTDVESRGLISVDFQNTSLFTVLNVLSMKTGRKFITSSDMINKKIVLSLKDVTADEALNALLDTYHLYYVRQGDTDIYVIRSKDDTSPITVSRVVFCNYAKAPTLEKVLAARLSQGGTIASDERTNSLIITDLADSIDKVEGLIRTLDIPTQQIFLESRIVDVNLSSDFTWQSNITDISKLGSNTFYEQFLGAPKAIGVGRLTTAIYDSDWSFEGNFTIGLEDKDSKVLNNPKLLVVNNQEATIEVIEEIPYLESSTMSASTGDVTGTTSFKDVGVKLRVKPQVNRDGSIILEVSPEQSFLVGYSVSNQPIVNTSRSSTTLMLKNGETVAIGGLIREFNTNTETKIPLIGDIPLIGYLFKNVTTSKTRRELTIFITAKIVN
jgi:type IV pilus assembly protein PilQ